ncbi:hypothetical protein EWB00_009362 [Schistosoma japonicum]|uniref:Hypotheticial protein n=1 Tax=Schistosoma japonicum TaxID=6182 RepID=C1L7A3_SCHJA|nr:hypothetical protein EWB00_009362 [Schistosoma japonicum]CAX70581.1 hypotheticial protein [Schistosoma japonicum]CAX75497.1 hypotheticial protein [Schistosoma japonicum]CAX75498.1 hypotheticial protein [Schistosoma japonicum]CAX75499.1 hypotheticial protein [Schistosoma japonicum]
MTYFKEKTEYVLQKVENYMRSGSRHMVYPWTLTAKIRQFPYVHVWKHRPYLKYYLVGLFICVPPCFYAFCKSHTMRSTEKHVNYFDPYDVPASELASHYHHLYHDEKH